MTTRSRSRPELLACFRLLLPASRLTGSTGFFDEGHLLLSGERMDVSETLTAAGRLLQRLRTTRGDAAMLSA
jgi:hypothetical protein